MACCGGGSASHRDSPAVREILEKGRHDHEREVKLLLLGAGESGKSTLAKQMKIIHLNGFSDAERNSYKSIIFNNILTAIRTLVNSACDLGIELEQENRALAAQLVDDDGEYFTGSLTPQTGSEIKRLWRDKGIQATFARSSEFQLSDSASYYFEHLDRVCTDGYSPTNQDLLRSRAKTTGIIETEFDVDKTHFRIADVGGQRSERKKWMHCFEAVTAVIFCVAMSEYDLKLYEDETTNRLLESLKLFKEICNSKWFVQSSMILFLNKSDLFSEKIKLVDLNVVFPEYTGGKNFEAASQYMLERFLALRENSKKSIYSHITCATDTDNIMRVFRAVQDTILRSVLNEVKF